MSERTSNPGVMPHGERVASLESKFDSLVDELRRTAARQDKTTSENHSDNISRLERLDVKVTATNGRVRSLELWKAMIIGALGIVAFALGELAKPLIEHWLKP
jgi:hypothetical protein